MSWKVFGTTVYVLMIELQGQTSKCTYGTCTPNMTIRRMGYSADGVFTGSCHVSHPDLRANPNARIHVRQDQVTHMHRLSEYQNTV
jgi:hypothetical protein